MNKIENICAAALFMLVHVFAIFNYDNLVQIIKNKLHSFTKLADAGM